MDAKALYRQQAIETASPATLISMLYHGAIARIDRAADHIEQGAPDLANADLQRTQEIVFELRASLDHERGGAIARNLDALYVFCIEQLVEANASKDAAVLVPVRRTLSGLCEAWDQMAAQVAAERPQQAAAPARGTGHVAAAG